MIAPDTRRFLSADAIPYVCVAACTALSLAVPSVWSQGRAAIPFLVSLIVFGLPHGACDQWVIPWATGRAIKPTQMAVFLSAYLGATLLTLALWRIAPITALIGFLLLTAWHWGTADATDFGARDGFWAVRGIARGVLLMAAPIALHGAQADIVLSALAGRFGATVPVLLIGKIANDCLWGSLVAQALIALRDFRALGPRPAAKEVMETLSLLVLFWSTPPLAAVGIYFLAWHGFRHMERLGRISPYRALPLGPMLLRLHLAALPMTLISLLGLGTLTYWLDVRQGVGPMDLIATYLAILFALTVPHAAVTFWLDRRWLIGIRPSPPPAAGGVKTRVHWL